jgi:hypothetical protein
MQLAQPHEPQLRRETTTAPTDTELADLFQSTFCISIDTQTYHDYATGEDTNRAPTIRNDSDDKLVALPKPTNAHRKQLKKVLRVLVKERNQMLRMKPFYGYKPQSTNGAPLLSAEEQIALVQSLRTINASQPIQRTDKWYAMRNRRLTASDFHKVLGTDCARETLAFDKATAILHQAELTHRPHTTPTFTDARSWGTIFEDVCVMVYSGILCKGAVVEEFGLLPHQTHTFLSASPDGICNEQSSSSEHTGRMLECKAPFSRTLQKNTIKLDYLAQMQGQMEVTGCSECDYLECKFEVSDHPLDTITTATQKTTTGEPLPHAFGYIASFPGSPQQLFQYGPLNVIDEASVKASVASLQCTDEQRERAMVCYWKLTDYQLLTVYRNPKLFNEVLFPKLLQTWGRVQELVDNNEMYENIKQHKIMRREAKKMKQDAKKRNIETYAFRNSS